MMMANEDCHTYVARNFEEYLQKQGRSASAPYYIKMKPIAVPVSPVLIDQIKVSYFCLNLTTINNFF